MTHGALVAHYQALGDASPIPVLIYNVPKFTGIDFALATLVALADHPRIVGIKDTSSNVIKMGSLLYDLTSRCLLALPARRCPS